MSRALQLSKPPLFRMLSCEGLGTRAAAERGRFSPDFLPCLSDFTLCPQIEMLIRSPAISDFWLLAFSANKTHVVARILRHRESGRGMG